MLVSAGLHSLLWSPLVSTGLLHWSLLVSSSLVVLPPVYSGLHRSLLVYPSHYLSLLVSTRVHWSTTMVRVTKAGQLTYTAALGLGLGIAVKLVQGEGLG